MAIQITYSYRAMLVDLAHIVKYLFSRKVIIYTTVQSAQTHVCKIVKSAYRLYLFKIPPLSEKKQNYDDVIAQPLYPSARRWTRVQKSSGNIPDIPKLL